MLGCHEETKFWLVSYEKKAKRRSTDRRGWGYSWQKTQYNEMKTIEFTKLIKTIKSMVFKFIYIHKYIYIYIYIYEPSQKLLEKRVHYGHKHTNIEK